MPVIVLGRWRQEKQRFKERASSATYNKSEISQGFMRTHLKEGKKEEEEVAVAVAGSSSVVRCVF